MNTFTKWILIACCIMLSAYQVNASHLGGADLNYVCLGNNQYEITLKIYRHCSGVPLNANANISYSSVGCSISGNITLTRTSSVFFSPVCPTALTTCNGGSYPGYEQVIYTGVVTLPSGCADLELFYSTCCRNGSATNITNPSNEHLTTTAVINTNYCNNSPEFGSLPIAYACVNTPIQMSHTTIELDGDSVVYTLTNPRGNTGPISWTAGGPFNGDPYTLDPVTGQLNFTASATGVYVFVVIAEEYRNGVKVGEVHRDMEYTIVSCNNNSVVMDSVAVYDDNNVLQGQGTSTTFYACPGEDLHFLLYLSDLDPNDTIVFNSSISTILNTFPNASVTPNYTNGGNQAIFDVFIPSVKNMDFSIGADDRVCPVMSQGSFSFTILPDPTCVTITGTVAEDANNNCAVDGGEHRLANFIVLAQKGSFVSYTTTDVNGSYSFTLDTGSYDVTIIPNAPVWQPCQAMVNVALPIQGSNVITDFPITALVSCPYMQVDISTPVLRQCSGAIYSVNYCNLGSTDAIGSYVEVTMDSNLIVDSASIVITSQVGNVYTFNLGNIPYGDCGMFNIYTRLNCDTSVVLGQTHCVQAHIHPDTICVPNPAWNGVNIDVEATCSGDSVTFEIRNLGAAMPSTHSYWVIEDDIIYHNGTFQLGMGATKTLKFPASGVTYRLEAEQPTAHPWSNIASTTIEGCAQGPFSTGFVNIFSLNDPSPFLSIDCQQNVGSYDPNDKQAYPEGYGTQHYIQQNEDLEYKIRFQNTGTAPAFTVVILDTLSTYLDPASIQPGAASHAYTWRLLGENVVEYRFDNINLPDSNSNEPASHGFIQFKIKQQVDNPLGSVIYNDAAIYFDFNEPIITNETYHTIGENFVSVLITGTEDILVEEDVEVKVYPNPFRTQATLEVVGGNYEELQLTAYDITGRNVLQHNSTGDRKILLQKGSLPQGIYVYQLKGDGVLINTGKFIVE